MAGHHAHRTRLIRLVSLFVLACLTVGLVRRFRLLYPSMQRKHDRANLNPTPHHNRVHGRWKAVRASLGLVPLSHAALVQSEPVLPSRSDKRASRFDLGSKRRAEDTTRRLPPLHFASDTRPAQPDDDKEKESNPTQ